MQSSRLGFGIVGTGMIAGATADAIIHAKNARLAAVSSRRSENAQSFAAKYPGAAAVQGVAPLLSRPDVEAVYIAAPTAAREEIALAAIAAGKHILIEKPFIDLASAQRITEAAAAGGVAFMEATHFVHHSRHAAILAAGLEQTGPPRSLHTAFYFPLTDRSNIRFDVKQEPMTALGDMAWYAMRAMVEYLRPAGRISKAATVPELDSETGAIVRASGLIAFESGEVSTFDAGYTAGTVLMDLQLLGTRGVLSMDDFVLDWANSRAFKNPDLKAGYFLRTGMATRRDAVFIPTPADTAQDVAMIENFVELAVSGTAARQATYTAAALKTQEYLDAAWASVRRNP